MVDGKCHRCTLLFDGKGSPCWCAFCHGTWNATLDYAVMFTVFSAVHDDQEHFSCPDCGQPYCSRASHHTYECDNAGQPA